MSSSPFLIILNYLAAFLTIIVAISIWLHPIRSEFYRWMSYLLIAIGLSHWLFSLSKERESPFFMQLSSICAGAYVAIALYIIIKFYVLKHGSLKPREISILRIVFYWVMTALVIMIAHYIYLQDKIFSIDVAWAAGILSLTSAHMISRIYSYQDERVLKDEVLFIVLTLVFSAVASGSLFIGGVIIIGSQQYFSAMWLIYGTSLIFTSIYRQLTSNLSSEVTHYLNVVNHLDKTSRKTFLRDVSQTGVFKKIEIISRAEIDKLECGDIYKLIRSGEVFNQTWIDESLKEIKVNQTNVGALLAIRTVLNEYKMETITRVGKTDSVLVASPEALISPLVFQSFLVHISVLAARFVELKPSPDGKVINISNQISSLDSL